MEASIGGFPRAADWDYAFRLVTLGLLTKAKCTARGILLLLDNNLVGDAQVLLRTLLELTIILLYIARAPERRALLYFNFQHITPWLLKQRLGSYPREAVAISTMAPDFDQTVEANYHNHKGPYLDKKGNPRRTWSLHPLREMAQEVNLRDLCDLMYPIDSGLVHSGPDGLQNYVAQADDGRLEILPQLPARRFMRILGDTANCLGRVTRCAAGIFDRKEVLGALD